VQARYREALASNREAAAMIDRSVCRQRPHSAPAPHAAATSLEVDAPRATQSDTVWLVAPTHRHTYISEPLPGRFPAAQPSRVPTGRSARRATELAAC
jgi:hypothetical protein